MAAAFVGYLRVLIPALEGQRTLNIAIGLAAIWAVTLVNLRGVEEARLVQVITNQNLNSSTVRLRLSPTDNLTLNLLYFHSHWTMPRALAPAAAISPMSTIWRSTTRSTRMCVIQRGRRRRRPAQWRQQLTGGNNVWYYSMFYTNISF